MLIVHTKVRLYGENAEFGGECVYMYLKRWQVIFIKQSDTYRSESAFIKSEPVSTIRSDKPIAGWGEELFFFLNQYRGKSKNGLALLLLIESSKSSLDNNYSPKP
ncbi:hypothetical protein HMPREF1869_00542 [Bacteroidales bacterium KA00251]|nr:hypothetical protein HMPREF1869_00542 [Bacteroidales bacterium KA00251]